MKKRNLIENVELKPYYLAKYASRELILEELVLSKGGSQSYHLEKYVHHPFRLKLKVIFTKLFYAFSIGILPLLPLLTYFEIINLITEGSTSIEVVYFIGGLLFSIYFCLQFLSFFTMGMLDTTMITSGKIFEWFETLPISRKKYLRIVYLTLFRSYDLPLIVLIFAFPITMLIGSQNIVIFFLCLGISIINNVLSFSILLIFGERINRILDINDTSSKKTLIIRLTNILFYVFIIISSYILIQWFSSSIETIYTIFITAENQSIINVILSFVLFPFNSGFLISLIVAPNPSSLQLWISTLIGFALLIILTYIITRKAFKAIERISISKLKAKSLKKATQHFPLEVKVNIKVNTPFIAYLRKDLRTITRDIKVFMSIILPILLSFIFVVAFGIKNIGRTSLIDTGFFQNWVGILTFSPILSGLIVYGLTNLDNLGETITATLPIIPRNRVKPQLLLIYFIQTCATLLPSLIFLSSSNFTNIFINFLFTLPLTWLFLLIIFILRIMFFGKKSPKFYVLEEYNPKNRMYKWTLIITIPYIIFFWMISFGISFFYQQDDNSMMVLYWAVLIIGFLISLLIFNKMLPAYQEKPIPKWTDINKDYFSREKWLKEDITPTGFSKHIWFSILILLIINLILFFLVYSVINIFFLLLEYHPISYPPSSIDNIMDIIQSLPTILIPILFYGLTWLYFIPKYIGLPYGKQPTKQFLDCIGLSWLKSFLTKKYIKTILIAISSISIIYFINLAIFDVSISNFYSISFLLTFLGMLIFYFWHEVLHRGIILTMLISKYSQIWALFFNTFILIIMKGFTLFVPIFSPTPFSSLPPSLIYLVIFDFIFSGFINLILGYIYLKKGSLLPGLISSFILMIFLPISFFVPFFPIYVFVSVSPY